MENNTIITTISKKQISTSDGDSDVGLAVHSQVIKIKQETEKIKHPSLELYMRRELLRGDVNRLRSRSPLGLAERAILVGHS